MKKTIHALSSSHIWIITIQFPIAVEYLKLIMTEELREIATVIKLSSPTILKNNENCILPYLELVRRNP